MTEEGEADLVEMLDDHIEKSGAPQPDTPIKSNVEPPSGPTSQVGIPIPKKD